MERWEFFKIGERAAKARKMITALNNGEREWRMSIPARPDVDPDVVIGASIADIPQLVAYIHELEQALEPFADGYLVMVAQCAAMGTTEDQVDGYGLGVAPRTLRHAHDVLHATHPSGAPEAPVRRSQGETADSAAQSGEGGQRT